MVNLCVSLAVALFFVPAMAEKIRLKKRTSRTRFLRRFPLRPKRLIVWFNRFYGAMIRLFIRRKWIPFTAIVLTFGLPVFLIPDKIEKETKFAKQYNRIFDNATYKEKTYCRESVRRHVAALCRQSVSRQLLHP